MSSASVIIDAGVLAVPQPTVTLDAAHRYVESLLDWGQLLDEPWLVLCMSERSTEALFADGLYPLRDRLQQLFSQHGIQEYDPSTVAKVIDRLLMHTPSFETHFQICDVLTEQVLTIPDVLQFCVGTELQADLARCLVLLAILRKHCGKDILDNALILRSAADQKIQVQALVHDIEHTRTDFAVGLPKPPEWFMGEVLVCDNFRGLLACMDESAILREAIDDAGVEIAIRISLYKARLTRFLEPDWDDVKKMRLGREFGEKIRRCCRNAPPAVSASALRAISETIDKQNMRAVHALRTGSGGNAPQRIRQGNDEAKAWRRDVDHEYHLHYWETKEGIIELASIGVHNDLSIPE